MFLLTEGRVCTPDFLKQILFLRACLGSKRNCAESIPPGVRFFSSSVFHDENKHLNTLCYKPFYALVNLIFRAL